MVSVSKDAKFIYVIGCPEHINNDAINAYLKKGYIVIRISNGNENARDCMKFIVESYHSL